MDDGEAPDGNDPEMGRRSSGVTDLEEEKGYNWFWCGVGLQSMENNRRCEGVEGKPGRRWGSASQRCVLSRAASSRRPDQAVPATLKEEDERLKVHAGRWI